MINIKELEASFQFIKGKTIALVYTFEGDNSSGLEHFFTWKGNIISKWLYAIQEIHCLPLILDVRTFVEKVINKTLPHIDYVLNLNTGMYKLSSMALVPSTCSSIGVPCIPCNAVSIVTGESKLLSNLIAKGTGLNVPKQLPIDNKDGIYRPMNLGNSLGVTRSMNSEFENGIYQEFIPGYEITTPIVYNSVTKKMDLLPTVMYIPDNNDLNWFNGEKEKITRKGYKFKIVDLDNLTKSKYLKFVDALSVKTFCRIDARVKCSDKLYYHEPDNSYVSEKDVYFIEINVMPTIRDNNNFIFSYDSIDDSNSFKACVDAQKETFGSISIYSFLLVSSMLSYFNDKTS